MKKFALIILVLLLLAGGGTAYYFLKVKTYDLSQDTVLEEITEDEYEIVLPPEDEALSDSAANVTGEESSAGAGENSSGDASAQTAPDKSQLSKTTTKATPESIIEKFRPSFENLEEQANGKINSLVSRAISEYREQKESGEEISYSYFLTKYKTAGEALEAKTDQAFNTVYTALQQDLKEHGFNPNEAEDVRTSYEAAKKHRRNAILSAAMEKL